VVVGKVIVDDNDFSSSSLAFAMSYNLQLRVLARRVTMDSCFVLFCEYLRDSCNEG